MSDSINPEVIVEQRPDPARLAFDLNRVLASLVAIRSYIPDEALTASVLGTERAGHGVIIDDTGLVVTIGYLVMEAEFVWLTTESGHTLQAHVLAYDSESGLGLVQALGVMGQPAMTCGSTARLNLGAPMLVAAYGGHPHALCTQVTDKREFAGYWEYLLDEAIFTAPAHPSWGGAALIGEDGLLYGIGSLLVQETSGDDDEGEQQSRDCNMFVPIDLLSSNLDDLKQYGRPNRSPRPWLGMFAYDVGASLIVAGVYKDGPADRADLRPGDVVVDVDGRPVAGLADFFRSIWAVGEAGVPVPLTVVRDAQKFDVTVQSVDRTALGQPANLH